MRRSRNQDLARRSGRAVLACCFLVAAAIVAPTAFAKSSTCGTPEAHGLLLISARSGAIINSFPQVEQASAVATDGHGGWFAAGDFACLAGARGDLIVHLDAAGRVDRAWHPQLGAARRRGVSGLMRSGDTLYATGAFGVIALNDGNGTVRWIARIAGGPEPGVEAIAASSSIAYVGGLFSTVDGEPHAGLVALDARTGRPIDWPAPSLGSYVVYGRRQLPIVGALALSGARLYIGGNTITTVDGVARPGFAAVDARTGALLPRQPAKGPPNVLNSFGVGVGDVETIVVARGLVFSAGHDGFGIVSARTGRLTGWMHKVDGVASRFAAVGDTVYLGGDVRNAFTAVGTQARNNLAAIDLAHGRIERWSPKLPTYVGIASIAADRHEVLVAGSFSDSLG